MTLVAPFQELAGRAQPVALAGERRLPVLPALRSLLPDGLRRGSVVVVEGATSLAMALLAAASAEGSWCAAVGLPSLGMAAAGELGVTLDRFPLVAAPRPGSGPGGWAWVVAALLDAFDVVLAGGPSAPSCRAADARRLTARVRERGAVLVVASPRWPESPAVRLTVAASTWDGPGRGEGRLRGRRLEVVATGRATAARERRARLWLPSPDGCVVEEGVEEEVRWPPARWSSGAPTGRS
jgi:hypothetical protein